MNTYNLYDSVTFGGSSYKVVRISRGGTSGVYFYDLDPIDASEGRAESVPECMISPKRLRFKEGDKVVYVPGGYLKYWEITGVNRGKRTEFGDYIIKDRRDNERTVFDNELEPYHDHYMEAIRGFVAYDPSLFVCGIKKSEINKPKQKKGLRQMAEKMTKTFIGWLSPDRQAVHKAFLNNDGELMFTPELQQYLLEKWMEDKDFIALAKRINKEKETNNN